MTTQSITYSITHSYTHACSRARLFAFFKHFQIILIQFFLFFSHASFMMEINQTMSLTSKIALIYVFPQHLSKESLLNNIIEMYAHSNFNHMLLHQSCQFQKLIIRIIISKLIVRIIVYDAAKCGRFFLQKTTHFFNDSFRWKNSRRIGF